MKKLISSQDPLALAAIVSVGVFYATEIAASYGAAEGGTPSAFFLILEGVALFLALLGALWVIGSATEGRGANTN